MRSLGSLDSLTSLMFEPDEGLHRAMPLPAEHDFGVDGVTDEEWQEFYEAVSEYRAPDLAHKDGR